VGYVFGQACSLAGLGYVALLRCDHGEAEQRLLNALDLMVRVGYVLGQAYCTVGLGHVALHRGDYARAERSFSHALAFYEQLKDKHSIGRMRRYLAYLQGGHSAIRKVPAKLVDNNGSLRLISVFRADPRQVGDLATPPMNYADALGLQWLSASEVLDIGDAQLQEKAGDLHRAVVIVGGGGLGFTDFQLNLRWIALQRPAVLIWWGAGLNAHFGRRVHRALADSFDQISSSDHDYPQVLSQEYFQLIGVRDRDDRNRAPSGSQWVPCVSAMHSAFDEPVQRTDEVRVYSHRAFLYDLGPEVRMLTNATRPEYNVAAPDADAAFKPAGFPVAGDAANAIRFIRSAGVLITNSFHGAYWAQLADVPVAVFAEFSTKFRQLPNQAAIVTVEQVRTRPEVVVDAARRIAASRQTAPGTLLGKARSANVAFAEQFLNLLADRQIQIAGPTARY